MKKKMRAFTALTLVGLLMATMTVPAMAETVNGSSANGPYPYSWTIVQDEQYGSAHIHTTSSPAYVTAQVQIQSYYYLTGTTFTHNPISTTGYTSTTAIDRDMIQEINGVPVEVNCTAVKASFNVAGYVITDGYYVGDWK